MKLHHWNNLLCFESERCWNVYAFSSFAKGFLTTTSTAASLGADYVVYSFGTSLLYITNYYYTIDWNNLLMNEPHRFFFWKTSEHAYIWQRGGKKKNGMLQHIVFHFLVILKYLLICEMLENSMLWVKVVFVGVGWKCSLEFHLYLKTEMFCS